MSAVAVRPLREADLDAAEHIMRLAFGTFLGMPEPTRFMGDADYVRTRFRASPESAFAAESGGELVGSNFATRWGSFGFFGPLSVHPSRWDGGVAGALMAPVMECFARWGVTHAGLYTFAQSPKHLGLYAKFGFHPRFLTLVLSKPAAGQGEAATLSTLAGSARADAIAACRRLADAVYPGLDLTHELESIAAQKLGDTLLAWDGERLAGFAACHHGAGSEGGSDTAYLKCAVVAPGPRAARDFGTLLDACDAHAARVGARQLVAGVSTARGEAWQALRARGYRAVMSGISMHRPNGPGWSRPGVWVLDDWR